MARRPDIEYIRYYTDGSAARQLEQKPQRKKRPLPKVKKQPQYILYIQPMAIVGILLSAVMLIMMIVGVVKLQQTQQQAAAMEAYVDTLRQENAQLTTAYHEGYDLEEIETMALALGMVPNTQVRTVRMDVPMVEEKILKQLSF